LSDKLNFVLQARRAQLEALEAAGVAPYAYGFDPQHSAGEAQSLLGSGQDGPAVTLAGRIVAWRSHGKTTFAHLADQSGRIQLYFRKDELGEELYGLVSHLDLGDIIGVPILPPYYSLRILPYVVPNIASWKRRVLRERTPTDSEEFDMHGI